MYVCITKSNLLGVAEEDIGRLLKESCVTHKWRCLNRCSHVNVKAGGINSNQCDLDC
jgi:hypothetical protein